MNKIPTRPMRIIFTDLDGSLLDHHSYGFAPAAPLLLDLERSGIPVIPTTSKTAAEVLVLRQQLNNHHPFIVENGAAIYIPQGYFNDQLMQTTPICQQSGFFVLRNTCSNHHWQTLLLQVADDFKTEFETFSSIFTSAGAEGLAKLTGLEVEAAELAHRREHSEPVLWLGSTDRKQAFTETLQQAGAEVLQGGRFLSVGGDIDKGRAMLQLRDLYLRHYQQTQCDLLAIGDSGNDIAMLEQATSALVIRSDNHGFPELNSAGSNSNKDIYYTNQTGPDGWVEGVSRWLSRTDHTH